MRNQMLHAFAVVSKRGNDLMEQFIIGFNEGKKEEIVKFLKQQQERQSAATEKQGTSSESSDRGSSAHPSHRKE